MVSEAQHLARGVDGRETMKRPCLRWARTGNFHPTRYTVPAHGPVADAVALGPLAVSQDRGDELVE